MTSAQRYWLSGFLVVFALVLAVYHLEWAGLEDTGKMVGGQTVYPSEERLVLPFYETYRKIGLPDHPNAEIRMVHGIFVRRSHYVTEGIIFGGLLPLVLIGASGFIALGARRAKQ